MAGFMSSKQPKVGFGTVDVSKLKQKISNIGKGDRLGYIESKYSLYKIKGGDNFIRVLPPPAGEDEFSYEFWAHRWIGPNGESFICMNKMANEECPFCERLKLAQLEEGDPETQKKFMRKIKPTERTIYWVLDIGQKPQADVPLILDAPSTLAGELLRQTMDKFTGEVVNIWDLQHGRSVYFESVETKGQATQYKGVQTGNEYALSAGIMDFIVPFEDILIVPDVNLMQEIAAYYENGLPQFAQQFGSFTKGGGGAAGAPAGGSRFGGAAPAGRFGGASSSGPAAPGASRFKF